jgi:hypothetical protein
MDDAPSSYIAVALRHAEIQRFVDGTYYGVIPGFPPEDAVWAVGGTLADLYDALQLALRTKVELLIRTGRSRRLPTIDGLRPT